MSFKVLLVLTSQASFGHGGGPAGTWLEELAAPYCVLSAAGCELTLATIAGGTAPLDPASLESPWLTDDGRRLLADTDFRARLLRSPSLGKVADDEFDALFMIGGAAVMWDFPNDPTLGRLLRRFADSGRVLGGVCHGVAGLLNAHAGESLVSGRRLTCISNREDVMAGFENIVPFMPETPLRDSGARISFATEPFGEHAIRDGLLVTGQNPASAARCGQLLLEALAVRAGHQTAAA